MEEPVKPIWLIETGVWKDDNVSRVIAILRERGSTVHAEQYTYLGGTEFELVDDRNPVIYYGSVNTGDYLRALRRNWYPLIWFDRDAFSCRSYYAHWGAFLLQEHYCFYPLAELPRLKDKLYQTFARDDMVFIRPDDNDKSFSGRLVPLENFPQWYKEATENRSPAAELVVVSSPVAIEAEWRFVIADRKVVAGSDYKSSGKLKVSGDSLRNAALFAEQIAAAPWQPRAIYSLDIACTASGQYRLVEINSINSSGLYRCELLPVIQAMDDIAEREFREWTGRK
jgi:hypothetical protein